MYIVNICPFQVYPPRAGGQLRIFNLNKQLAKQGNRVEQYSLIFKPSKQKIIRFGKYTEIRIFNPVLSLILYPLYILRTSYNFILPIYSRLINPPRELIDAIQKADIVQLEHPFLFPWIDKYARNKTIALVEHNVEYDLEKQSLKTNRFIPKIIKNQILKSIYHVEKSALKRANVIFCVSQMDKIRLGKLFKIKNINYSHLLPNGVNADIKSVNNKSNIKMQLNINNFKTVILFIGSRFNPNVEAVRIIEKLITPNFDNSTLFLIVGSVSNAKRRGNIIFTGQVKSVKQYLQASDIAINPIISGSGTNMKLLEYMAYGLPVITTPHGNRGYDFKNKKDLVISNIKNFPLNIKSLIDNTKIRNILTNRGIINSKKNSWNYLGKIHNAYYLKVLNKSNAI